MFILVKNKRIAFPLIPVQQKRKIGVGGPYSQLEKKTNDSLGERGKNQGYNVMKGCLVYKYW